MANGVQVNEALRQRFAPHLDRPAAGGPTEESGKSRAVPASVKLVSPSLRGVAIFGDPCLFRPACAQETTLDSSTSSTRERQHNLLLRYQVLLQEKDMECAERATSASDRRKQPPQYANSAYEPVKIHGFGWVPRWSGGPLPLASMQRKVKLRRLDAKTAATFIIDLGGALTPDVLVDAEDHVNSRVDSGRVGSSCSGVLAHAAETGEGWFWFSTLEKAQRWARTC